MNGWQLSSIITYQSGFPIRIEDLNDGELESSFFFEDANTPTATAPVQFLKPQKNGNLWFNANNFADPTTSTSLPLAQFGNTPHSLCCGPAISNTDFVIAKKTPINERWNTEFRAEFYNLWNHTQFSNPDGNFTDGHSAGRNVWADPEGPRRAARDAVWLEVFVLRNYGTRRSEGVRLGGPLALLRRSESQFESECRM